MNKTIFLVLRKHFVTMLFSLFAMSATAADFIERTKPTNEDVPQVPVEFQVGKTYLLYNVTADKFFTQGNTWGTRGCIGPKASAVLVKVSQYKVDDVWDGKTYEIEDYVTPRTGNYIWYKVCMDDAGNIYTDQNTWGNRFYEFQKQDAGTNVYRIMPNEVNELHKSDGTQFLGRDDAVSQDFSNAWKQFTDDNERYPLSAMLIPGDGIHIDWQFIDASIFAIYDKSQELKAEITKAEEAGIDVTAAVNIYNNLNSTLADITDAIATLEEAMESNIANATGQFPQDASAWITNGTFNTIGDFTGWSTNNGKFGAGGTTSTNAEVYGKNAFDINQDITILYPGLYLFGVKGFYRAGSADNSYQLFSAGSDEARLSSFYVTINGQTESLLMSNIFDGAPTEKPAHGKAMASNGFWIPNTMADANEFFHTDGLYGHILPVEVSAADVTARIGVKKDQATSYDAWSIFDDFTLIFCGAGDDRWVGYAKTLAAGYPLYTDVTAVTQSYLDAYLNLKNNPAANNKDEALAYVAQLDSAQAALDLNSYLWKIYEDSVTYAQALVQVFIDKGQGSVSAVAQLNTYLSGRGQNAQKKIEARALTNEQLREELNKLRDFIQAIKHTVDILVGTDMTDYLVNPAFDTNDWTGWTKKAASGGNVAVFSNCCEAWNNSSFDIYQEVSDMPVGIYEISVQGFYRYGRGQNAFNMYNNGEAPKNSPAYIYMNANTTSFMNIFAEPTQITDVSFYKNPETNYAGYTGIIDGEQTTLYFPDGMSSAARAFDNNMFVNSAFGAQVSKEDKMRIGVKGSSNQLNDSWALFDNFKLTFWGKQADKVILALEGAIIETEGYLTNTDLRVGANIKGELTTAIETAQEIYNTQKENGDTLFAALVNLYNMKAKVRESEALLNGLAAVADSLKEKVQMAEMDMVLVDAKDLMDNIGEGLQQRTISDDDVAGLIEQLHAQMAIADKCIELRDAINLFEIIRESSYQDLDEGKISIEWFEESEALIGEIIDLMESGTLVIDEIPSWIERINVMISKRYKPVDLEFAGDDNPIDCTAMIQSPSFSKYDYDQGYNVNSIDGWQGTNGYNFGNDYTQRSALALEFWHRPFNMYQNIAGLPTGTYELRANAFARYDAESDSIKAYLFADIYEGGMLVEHNRINVQDFTSGMAMKPIDEYTETIDEETGELISDSINYGTTYELINNEGGVETGWVPNDMVSAVKWFENGYYNNSVIAKVEEGQTLRIGIMTENNNTWVIMDDFQLIAYGPYSSKRATGDPDFIIDITPLIAEADSLANGHLWIELKNQLQVVANTYREVTENEQLREGREALQNILSEAYTSQNYYSNLESLMEELSGMLTDNGYRTAETLEAANAFFTETRQALDNETLDNTQCENAISQAYQYINQLNKMSLTIHVEEAGTLDELVKQYTQDYYSIVGLTVSGHLDSNDLSVIRQMRELTMLDMQNTDVTEIPDRLFNGRFRSLTRLVLPVNIEFIGTFAFRYSPLTELEFPTSLRTINSYAFQGTALKKVVLPEGFESLYNSAFSNSSVEEVVLPSTITYVGSGAFLGCNNLTKMTCYAVEPPTANGNIMGGLESQCTLIVPEDAIDAYMENEYWNQFNIVTGDGNNNRIFVYNERWLNSNDSTLAASKPIIKVGMKDRGEGYWEPERYQFGNLTVEGENTLSAGIFTIHFDPYVEYLFEDYGMKGERASAVLINNAPMRADSVRTELRMCANIWNFICLPFDVKVSNIQWAFNDQPYAIYKYDGQKRAAADMDNTWVRMTADSTLKAGIGYIWQTAYMQDATGRNHWDISCTLQAENNVNKNNIFQSENAEVAMAEYLSEFAQNRSWNLIGNPYPSYFDSRAMDITAPFTVWNVQNQNYEAYSPMDDEYIFAPAEAFFFQRPIDQATINFMKEGRQSDRYTTGRQYFTRARQSDMTAQRYVFNLTLNGNDQSDRTRFVINEEAKTDYELDKDASKFAGMKAGTLMLYTVEQGMRLAINERPLAKGKIMLGTSFGERGTYTLALDTKTENTVMLIDRETGNEVVLDAQGYTFETEAGTFDQRFVLVMGNGETTGIQVNENKNENENMFDLQGRRIMKAVKGLYINNGKKVVVK